MKKVINDVRTCNEECRVYNPERTPSDRLMLAVIQPNSVVTAIIAKSMEDGAGLRRAHEDDMDYQYRWHEAGDPDVQFWGLVTARNFYISMSPTVTPVQRRAQGSNGPDSALCQAAFRWETQLLLRTQVEIPPERGGSLTEEEKKLSTLVPGK